MKRKICALLALIILLSILPMAASADSSLKQDDKGSITIKAVYQKAALEGLKLNCIQVGKLISTENGFSYECLFDKEYVYTSENIHDPDNPGDMLKLVNKSSEKPVISSADKNGNLLFNDLKPGLYLIYQTEEFIRAGKKYAISAFLVTVPYNGEMDVDAACKPGLDLYPEKPTSSTSTSTSKLPKKLPQTGQLSWPIPVMATCGMLLFAIGWWLCFKSRKDPPYEK